MLSEAKHFLEKEAGRRIRDWYYTFIPSQSTVFSPDRCCLSIDHRNIILMQGRKSDKLIELALAQTFTYKHPREIKTILTEVVEKQGLKGVRCSWILRPEQYHFLQTEALPVPPSEFQSAIRWKVKDLLRFPLEDAIIDSFPVPLAKLPTSMNTIMLVVARASILKPIADSIAASGLRLTTIDIPELSFRNITALYESDEKSTALIYLQEENTQLIVTNQQQLYFSRRLDFGIQDILLAVDNKEDPQALDQLTNSIALELQRSFDYYQSQWRQPEPARILLESWAPIPADFTTLLAKRLSVNVNKIDLDHYFNNRAEINLKLDGYYLPLLGGLLREWEKSYVAGN